MIKKFLSLPPVSFGLAVADTYTRAGISRSAAALSYFLILTLFPVLMCVHYFIGLFHLSLEQALASLHQVLPQGVIWLVEDYLRYVADMQSPALLVACLFTILVSASAGLRTLFLTMDELYGAQSEAGLARLLLSVALSALFLLTIYLSILVIFTGSWFFRMLETRLPPDLLHRLPLGALSELWLWLRYLLLFCAVLLLVLAVYRIAMPKHAAPRKILHLAAVLTALAMAACSVAFSWFIGLSSRYALVYGSLASLIILLVWLYSCGNILLLGAVVSRVWSQRLKEHNA